MKITTRTIIGALSIASIGYYFYKTKKPSTPAPAPAPKKEVNQTTAPVEASSFDGGKEFFN